VNAQHGGGRASERADARAIFIEQRQQLLETSDVITRLDAILDLIKGAQKAA